MSVDVMPTRPGLKHRVRSSVGRRPFQRIEALYTVRNASEIRQFLQNYPDLFELLSEAYTQVSKYFGRSPQITLELVKDPEIDDTEQLFAYIRTSLPVNEALTRLNKFDEEWFITQSAQVVGLFNFNLANA